MDGRMDRLDGWIDKGIGRNKYGWMRGWARENIEEQKDKLMNYDRVVESQGGGEFHSVARSAVSH